MSSTNQPGSTALKTTAFETTAEDNGKRLDRFLADHLPEISRVRAQELIAAGQVLLDGSPGKASARLRPGQSVEVLGPAERPPLRALPEAIPLDIVYEDDDLAVVNKPAGMMVHAGAGATDDARNRGTLVNALLGRFDAMSGVGGELRPGIVHRLDRMTSGLMLVAKNDLTHRRLAEQFAGRQVHKTYLALVHGNVPQSSGTIKAAISRDLVRRMRMTTRRSSGREAITEYRVLERIASRFGLFTMLEVTIKTGRTHQIRVHLSSIGHPVVGDTLYGAPRVLRPQAGGGRSSGSATSTAEDAAPVDLSLARNFLHSAAIEFKHPRTGAVLRFHRGLPDDLARLLALLKERF